MESPTIYYIDFDMEIETLSSCFGCNTGWIMAARVGNFKLDNGIKKINIVLMGYNGPNMIIPDSLQCNLKRISPNEFIQISDDHIDYYRLNDKVLWNHIENEKGEDYDYSIVRDGWAESKNVDETYSYSASVIDFFKQKQPNRPVKLELMDCSFREIADNIYQRGIRLIKVIDDNHFHEFNMTQLDFTMKVEKSGLSNDNGNFYIEGTLPDFEKKIRWENKKFTLLVRRPPRKTLLENFLNLFNI